MKILNYAPAFLRFYDKITANMDQLTDEELFYEFKSELYSATPIYYEIILESFKMYQSDYHPSKFYKLVRSELHQFANIRPTFEKFAQSLETLISEGIRRFKKTFPDFTLKIPILIGHSMASFDGAVRTLRCESYLMFGLDIIAKIYHKMRPNCFLIHELFHQYHDQFYEPLKEEGESLLDSLWKEGLAVYISELLVPNTSFDEMLLNIPEGLIDKTQKNISSHASILLTHLDEYPLPIYQDFFPRPIF